MLNKHNFTRKFVAVSLLATSAFNFSNLSNDSVHSCYENKVNGAWQYLEYHLIIQPNNKIQAQTKQLQAGFATAAAVGLLSEEPVCNYFGINNYKKEKDGGTSFDFSVPKHIAALVLGAVVYTVWYNKIDQTVKKETVIKFLKNWSHHRNFIPQELVPAFDELAASLQASKAQDLSNSQVNEILEIIQQLVEHSFEKRYSKDKGVDVLGTLKTITDIGKNLK